MLAKVLDDTDSYLGYPVPAAVRRRLLRECWEACEPDPERAPDMQAYFDSHPSRCRPFLNDGGIHISIRTYSELIALAKETLGARPRQDVMVMSAAQPASRGDRPLDDQAGDTALALCVALLVMMDIGSHQYSISGSTVLRWDPDETLRHAVNRHFQSQKGILRSENARLGKLFTTRNLDLVGGLNIKWTHNLVDHLRLADDDKTVFIFHSVSFLKFHQTFGQGVFPKGFVEETLRTLALLFPENDSKSRKWTASQIETKQDQQLDPGLAKCGTLRAHERRLEQFSFWHDRLVILKQTFDESSPRTLTQWWNDRRNSVQWYTFWVAIMVFAFTLFFGFVQSVEGGLQVWLAWEARSPDAD
ncbi:hypothetical protein Cob_v010488 [Colletotrichum orbiculare MAFF 240422]|uniref:Uncharacterized protein n=1 Tax=Colletotrichum orbiculare (strain 104-T / ATCC 96160 / CBS 514.97 / LARS 414 / MAFF 240422) TaxID=1213857 RepID=N4UVC0_COLOR|nr:hypothetical protein Cob_v010488 [Colletotrichum orbiculare MAFF 240422]